MTSLFRCPLCSRLITRRLIGFIANPGECVCEREVQLGERIHYILGAAGGEYDLRQDDPARSPVWVSHGWEIGPEPPGWR